jgi:hypothetical protein
VKVLLSEMVEWFYQLDGRKSYAYHESLTNDNDNVLDFTPQNYDDMSMLDVRGIDISSSFLESLTI